MRRGLPAELGVCLAQQPGRGCKTQGGPQMQCLLIVSPESKPCGALRHEAVRSAFQVAAGPHQKRKPA